MLAVFSLVFAATDTAFCVALISSKLAESRILPATPADTRPRTRLILFCTAQLRTLRRSLFGDSLKSLVQALGSCPSSGGLHGVPPCPHSSWKGSGTNYNRREGISPHFLTQTFFAELKQQKVAKRNHWSVTCC